MRKVCKVFEVSRSGYERWLKKQAGPRVQERSKLIIAIKQIHKDKYMKHYGRARMAAQLRAAGFTCSEKLVGNLMRQEGVRALPKRVPQAKMVNGSRSPYVAPNLLKTLPPVSAPNQVWVTDLTEIPTREGRLFQCAFMDLCSRTIVGWKIDECYPAAFVSEAFRNSLSRLPAMEQPLVVHSDRGSQFVSEVFKNDVALINGQQSMSGKGKCFDNAAMESFWATLKKEAFPSSGIFESKSQARKVIFEYIETFYNSRRLHSALGYVSPLEFENRAIKKNLLIVPPEKGGDWGTLVPQSKGEERKFLN